MLCNIFSSFVPSVGYRQSNYYALKVLLVKLISLIFKIFVSNTFSFSSYSLLISVLKEDRAALPDTYRCDLSLLLRCVKLTNRITLPAIWSSLSLCRVLNG